MCSSDLLPRTGRRSGEHGRGRGYGEKEKIILGSGGCFTQVEHPPFYAAARGLARLPLNGVPAARLRAGHARPLRSTRGSDFPLPGVFSGATGGHGAVKTAPYKPPAIAASRGRLFLFGTFFHLFCAFGIFFDCFAQIGCFCGSYYTIMIKHWRMYIFTARLLRL